MAIFFPFANIDRSVIASTSGRTQHNEAKSFQSSHYLIGRPINELFEQEFHACCYIPNSIYIQLSDEKALSIDRLPNNMVYFTKNNLQQDFVYPSPS